MESDCPLAEEEKLAFPTFRRLTRHEIYIALALWAFLTLFSIGWSYARGKLSIPLGWDDTGYFLDAYRRLQVFYDHGFGAVIKGYISDTPHSPMSTALAFFGFLLFGIHDLGPYILNSFVVLVLIVYVLKFVKTANPLLRWLAPAYVCTIPLAGMGIIEFRPDFAACVFVSLGIVTTISQPFVRATRSHLMVGGALFGLAILSKPTFLPFTVFIWGCSAAAALACDFFATSPTRSARGAVRATAIQGATMAAFGLLYLAFGWHKLLNYIRGVMFSDKTKIWTSATKGTFTHQALYYLTGEGGKQMLGVHLWILGAWIVVGFLFLPRVTRNSRLRWGALMALILISYIFFSTNPAKGPHWGLAFHILMVFAALASFQTVLDWIVFRRFPSILQYLAATSLLLPGLYFLQPWYAVRGSAGNPYTAFLWDAHTRILDVVANQKMSSPVITYITSIGDLNQDSLHWMAIKRGINADFPESDPISDDAAYQMRTIEQADVLVVPERDTPGIYSYLPGSRTPTQIFEMLGHDPRYSLVEKIPALSGKFVFVWLKNSFRGWTPISGFEGSEGPYPKAHLPRVRWSLGPKSQLIPLNVRAGAATITGSGLTYAKDQEMEVRIGGSVIGLVKFPETKKFVDFSFSTTINDPSQPITLTFSNWDRTDAARPMAVLFRSFNVISQSQNPDAVQKD